MDLWIRSQDKEGLFKVDNIKIEKYNGYSYIVSMIKDKEVKLGEYGFHCESRALEVLDEIQEILVPAVVFKNITDSDNVKEISELYKLSEKCVLTSDNADIHYVNSTYVYQMPKE